jgi:hypothetical protein
MGGHDTGQRNHGDDNEASQPLRLVASRNRLFMGRRASLNVTNSGTAIEDLMNQQSLRHAALSPWKEVVGAGCRGA